MLNNLLSLRGYQDGGVVPSFSDLLGELNIQLPSGYNQWTYEYDPAHEDFLSSQFTSEKTGLESARDYGIDTRRDTMEYGIDEKERAKNYAIGGAYSNLLSGFRDISEQGMAALTQARGGGGGGFQGSGGNLLGMSVKDIYSGAESRRGSALGGYTDLKEFEEGSFTDYEAYQRDAFGDYETYQTDETQRLIDMLSAQQGEDVRVGREDWERGAMSHLLDLQNLYGKPFDKIDTGGFNLEEWQEEQDAEACVASGGEWDPQGKNCIILGAGGPGKGGP
tara:strand:- start:115 stop:948 length:834 start_codon:yes stop_codon:yes gene_type:complete